jgi:hypothetical protein
MILTGNADAASFSSWVAATMRSLSANSTAPSST